VGNLFPERELLARVAKVVGTTQKAIRASTFARYRPVEFQREWFESDAAIEVLVAGNQSGKRRPMATVSESPPDRPFRGLTSSRSAPSVARAGRRTPGTGPGLSRHAELPYTAPLGTTGGGLGAARSCREGERARDHARLPTGARRPRAGPVEAHVIASRGARTDSAHRSFLGRSSSRSAQAMQDRAGSFDRIRTDTRRRLSHAALRRRGCGKCLRSLGPNPGSLSCRATRISPASCETHR
jgi:hypothetical protein